MKRRIVALCLTVCLFMGLFSVPVFADTGPKPSVVVDFEGMEGEIYYVTLLAKESSTGPYSKAEDGYAKTNPRKKSSSC